MNKKSLGALAAAGLLAGCFGVTSASAADFGGDCCADLEERVAELEATTARKGNRKVSLTVSGWVAEQVMWWDDGQESNVYVQGIGNTLSTHFKFSGGAQITSDWSAGYTLHIEARDQDPLVLENQTSDEAGNVVSILTAAWHIKSNTYGKITVGRQSQASDNAAILVDGSGSLVPANWVMFEGAGYGVRTENGNNFIPGGYLGTIGLPNVVSWGDLGYCHTISTGIGADCNGQTLNVVRYDTPTFAGFSASASWGEDDMWDVALRYAGELGAFRVAAVAAYSETTDHTLNVGRADIGKDIGYFQTGAYLQHVPTGLFVYGAWGQEYVNNAVSPAFGLAAGTVERLADNGDHWMVKAGIRQKWNALGHTVAYGFYGQMNDMLSPDLIALGATGSEIQRWGVGAVQEIDAAAMSMWLQYQQLDGEIGAVGANVGLEELHMVKFGALIAF